MKNLLLACFLVIGLFSLFGCQQNAVNGSKDMEGFVEPNSDREKYLKLIREYMYTRTQAVVNKDVNILWKKYPDLKDNIDRKHGVNVEKYEVESLNDSFYLLDANYNIESYEHIKVKSLNENEVIVLVHGSISYLRNDFDESGGEYLIKVYLKNKDNLWTVVKTDEYTLPEYKEWLKNK